MTTATLRVPNISCHHCVNTIRRELSPLAGVESVEATVEPRQVTVTFEPDDVLATIKTTLAEIGYPVADQEGTEGTK